jgi:hypothetical protein
MNEPIETILAQCLAALQTGAADVEECLRRFPDRREELEPVLRAWEWVQNAPEAVPSMKFQREAHDRLLSKLGQQEAPRRAKRSRRPLFAGLRWVLVALAAMFALLASGAGVAYASEGALPGDALYSAKTTIEGVRLAFADSEGDVALFNEFANRRVEEMQALVAAGRPEDLPAAAQGYEHALEGMAQALAQVAADDEGKAQALADVLDEAHQKRTEVLNGLLERAPEAAQKGLQRALEAGPPEGKGKPEGTGKPDDPGCEKRGKSPEDKGKPEDKGRPEDAGPPEDSNAPEDAGPPEDRCAPEESGDIDAVETPEPNTE